MDELTLHRAKRGDPAAFEALVHNDGSLEKVLLHMADPS